MIKNVRGMDIKECLFSLVSSCTNVAVFFFKNAKTFYEFYLNLLYFRKNC